MGQQAARYFLPLVPDLEEDVVVALREAGAEPGPAERTWLDLRVRDEHRYWIDLRLHRGPEPQLEIRIALTNDERSIRAPLEEAFSALPPAAAERPLRDEDGAELGAPAQSGWSLRLEQDYARRRAEFVRRVGEVTAPISADHVYLYVDQTRWSHDNDIEDDWNRDREISRMEDVWDLPSAGPEPPPGDPDPGD